MFHSLRKWIVCLRFVLQDFDMSAEGFVLTFYLLIKAFRLPHRNCIYDKIARGNVIRTNENSLDIEVGGKRLKAAQSKLDMLDVDLKAFRLHPDQAITDQNGASDQEESTLLLNWRKAKEENEE